MISALLLCFLLQFAVYLINTIGKQTINDVLWLLYTKLPTSRSKQASDLSTLRREVVRLNREMTATSAQDEFAKWAKLRRQHDKAKESYETQAREFQSFRTTFDRLVTLLRFLSTQGLQFGATMYYGSDPMFWLPQGWVPYQVEWILSFPRAPLGSISINVWAIACGSVIALVGEGIMAVWTLRTGVVKEEGPRKGEKVKLEKPVEAAGSGRAGSEEKKEL